MLCAKAPIAVVPRPRPRPDVQVWPRALQNHGLNRKVAPISALRAIRPLPADALPFLSVPRHVQVSSGRLTVMVALSCNRHFTMSRFPRVLSRLAFPPAKLVPSWRHPWGSSLQRFDLVLSPVHLSVRRALLFLGRSHHRRSSHSLRFAAVRTVCRVSCRLRLEIRRSAWLRVGPVPLSRERLLQGAVGPRTSPSGNGFAGRRTSRVAPVDFANILKSRSFQMPLDRVPYDG